MNSAVVKVMVAEQQKVTALAEVQEAKRLLESAASRFLEVGHTLNGTQLRVIAAQLRVSAGPDVPVDGVRTRSA